MTHDDLMRTFYTAVSAVEDGKCAEIEVGHETDNETDGESAIERISTTVRREVKHWETTYPRPDKLEE